MRGGYVIITYIVQVQVITNVLTCRSEQIQLKSREQQETAASGDGWQEQWTILPHALPKLNGAQHIACWKKVQDTIRATFSFWDTTESQVKTWFASVLALEFSQDFKVAISPASTLHQLSSFSSFSGLVIQCVSKLVNPDVAASPSTILDQLETHLDIISPDVACPGKASTPLQR